MDNKEAVEKALECVKEGMHDGDICGPTLAAEVLRLRKVARELASVLAMSRESLRVALDKEGYAWEGEDCDTIDRALAALGKEKGE